jgi:hypothetical protein
MTDPSFPNSLPARPLLGPALTGASGRRPLLPPAPRGRASDLEPQLAKRQRTRLWEFGTNLHCSIIGTCLCTGELRQVLSKIGRKEALEATEHDVHASAVLVAAKHQEGAKLLHKALDRRHRLAISQFGRAKTAAEVRELWQEASKRGDIPGAYWAALTHPATNDAIVREIFAEVHMLSHLVGAANRADIRRLRLLEAEKEELEARLRLQQERLGAALAARDEALREAEAIRDRQATQMSPPPAVLDEGAAIELKARLARTESHSERVEHELAEMRAALAAEQIARAAAEEREAALRSELDAVETGLGAGEADIRAVPATGLTFLYVGGRPSQVGRLRRLAERAGAVFLYHDGGLEEREGLLPGLVSRADAVLFPVDCISHTAMLLVKRLCRQAAKRFVPLRSAGPAPFYAALVALAASAAKAE